MEVIQAAVLGIIQGLTEFLPVSSSGHLIFLPKLFGWAVQGLAFDAMIHLGTLVAVVWYFRRRFCSIIKVVSSFNSSTSQVEVGEGVLSSGDLTPPPLLQGEGMKEDKRLGWLILLSVIPAGVVGLLFGDWIEANLRSAGVVAFGMIFWAVVLYIAEIKNQSPIQSGTRIKNFETMGWKSALFIGCAQAVALVPGTSRSGITMTAGLFSKLDKKSAAEFSFLMSAPIIALAGLKSLFDLWQGGWGDLNFLALLVGLIVSALSGLLAIWGLLKILQKWSFKPFVVYRIVVGLLILWFL